MVAVNWDVDGAFEPYLLDGDTGEATRLDVGGIDVAPAGPLVWSPDGERLYLHGADLDVYALPLEGSATPVVTGDGRCILWDVDPDHRFLLYSRRRPGAAIWDSPRRLYRYDRTAGEHVPVTPTDEFVLARGNVFDPDGERIAYAAAPPHADLLERSEAYVIRVADGDRRRIDAGHEGARTVPKAWHPDGRRLLMWDEVEVRCGVYDLGTDAVEWYGSGTYGEKPVGFFPGGDRFLAIRKERTRSILLAYDLRTGTARELDVGGVVQYAPTRSAGAFFDDGAILVPRSTPTTPPELLRYHPATGEATVLASAAIDVEEDVPVEPEYVTYPSADGLEVGALLYDSGVRPSPAVVLVHGGRHGRARECYHWPTQLLVTRGYAVLRPNYRGSSGRGREFRRLSHGDVGGGDAADVAAAGRWLAAREWIDADRIAVCGHSYGGYLAYLQMVRHHEPWAAGIASAGFTDLVSIYDRAPDLPGLDELGDPDEDPDPLRERSPIAHVGDFQGPLLMLHDEDDPVCPVEEARRFREALLEEGFEAGEDFEYVEFEEGGHGRPEREYRLRRWRRIERFLRTRLR